MGEEEEPLIEPSSFDLIVSGTGLPETLIAAAAASASKSVLHIDPNPFYGSHFSSLSPLSLSSFLAKNPPFSLYSDAEFSGEVPEKDRSFSIDFSGPRLILCGDFVVDLLIKSGASNHVDFKSLDGTLIYCEKKLVLVPDSREAVFKDKNLSLKEKTLMTRFLKLISGWIESKDADLISEEDLGIPFVEFLEKERLPMKIKQIILYAIAMSDYDQDNSIQKDHLIGTKDGLERLAVYVSSIGRFPNAVGALIYPMYGHGELPQAFSRLAAVKGTLYVLRMSASSLIFDEAEKRYRVRLASGQEVYSKQILMDSSSLANLSIESTIQINHSSKVARLICISKRSLYPELSNILIVLPPRSLFADQEVAIRVLQLGSGLAVCPPGYFVVYFSVKCEDGATGKKHLLAAMDTLFKLSEDEETDPSVVWSASFIQNVSEANQVSSLSLSATPDGNLDYRSVLKSTEELFHKMYPQEEFFPASKPSEGEQDNTETLEE